MEEAAPVWSLLAPLDYRYAPFGSPAYGLIAPYLSLEAATRYSLRVEMALARTLAEFGLIRNEAADEIVAACEVVTPADVALYERRYGHQTVALVEAIRACLSPAAKPYVHLFATSSDTQDSALALRLRDFTVDILVPELAGVALQVLRIAQETSSLPQIGRTHGQFAEPVTFGFSLALFVDRLGSSTTVLSERAMRLRGKFSGSVGAYNTLAMCVPDPEAFERCLLARLGLTPEAISSQIVQPEPLVDLTCSLATCLGVIANLADDLRHLARSEIGEVSLGSREAGSSAMPHKVNPWQFEHVKSMWKALIPQVQVAFLDQLSEHQRDLTGSASRRFLEEFFATSVPMILSFRDAVGGMRVDERRMASNLKTAGDLCVSEAVKVALALAGEPEPDNAVREIVCSARESGQTLRGALMDNGTACRRAASSRLDVTGVLSCPERFTGRAQKLAEDVCSKWEPVLLSLAAAENVR